MQVKICSRSSATTTARASRAPAAPTRSRMGSLPKLVAFDLDATLWFPEMYMLSGPPFRLGKCSRGRPVVVDRSGDKVGLLGDAWAILQELSTEEKWAGTQIAYVSRTDEPEWANQCLQMLTLGSGASLHSLAHHHEIYPGSKLTHFRRIHERTGIAYTDMLFLDDMQLNIRECAKLGLVAVHTPKGLTAAAWQKGLQEFAERPRRGKAS